MSVLRWVGILVSLFLFISFETSRRIEREDFSSLERIKVRLRSTVGSKSFNFGAIYLRQSPRLDFVANNRTIFILTSLSVIVLLTTYETLLTAELVSPSVLKAVKNLKEFVGEESAVIVDGSRHKIGLTNLAQMSQTEFQRQGVLKYFNSTKLVIPDFHDGLLYLAFSKAFEISGAKRVGIFNQVYGSGERRAYRLKMELRYFIERKRIVECFSIESGTSEATFSIFQVHNREYFRRKMAHFKQQGFESFWKSVIDLRDRLRLLAKIDFFSKFDDTSSDYISFTNLKSFVILCLFCVAVGFGAMIWELGEKVPVIWIRIKVGILLRRVLKWKKFLDDCGKILSCTTD